MKIIFIYEDYTNIILKVFANSDASAYLLQKDVAGWFSLLVGVGSYLGVWDGQTRDADSPFWNTPGTEQRTAKKFLSFIHF